MSRAAPEPRIPHLTAARMAEVDRLMIEEYGIELIQMMENAGRCLAHLARTRFLDGDPEGKRVTVLAGTGGNGGGALAAARRLTTWGAKVRIYLTRPPARLTPVPAKQHAILERMGARADPDGLPAAADDADADADVVLDGLIGYSLRGAPRGRAADLIRRANAQQAPVLSLDVPSGLDATTGEPHDPTIRATATMTLALPKTGLAARAARHHTGEIHLADIGVPPSLYAEASLALDVGTIFAREDVIRIA